jgi:hypothetical protein
MPAHDAPSPAPTAALLAAARKRRPPEPLAFVAAAITGVTRTPAGDAFVWRYRAWVVHAASGDKADLSGASEIVVETSEAKTRAGLAIALRSKGTIALEPFGHRVPFDRVAVVLF